MCARRRRAMLGLMVHTLASEKIGHVVTAVTGCSSE
jgi:hypothetical protein